MATAIATSRERVFGWRALVLAAGVAQLFGLAAVALALADVEAAALAAATLVGLALLRVRALAGTIVLGLLFADVAFFTVAAAIANVLGGAGATTVAVPAALGAVAAAGLIAAIGAVARRGDEHAGAAVARYVVVAAGAAVVVAVLAAAVAPARAASAPNAFRLDAKNTRYSTTSLEATAGPIAVRMTNGDFFWHTFTIDELGVDLYVPVGGELAATFSARPGTYTYYCRVPGHAAAGMRGTLRVR